MAGKDVERRLAAILAADVVGYSRMMEADEADTLARLKAHLGEFIRPTIDGHRGNVVKTTGDGLLAEFASVVAAVECAVAIQRGMIQRSSTESDGRQIRFRIGINLGDIIIDDGDIFGDGVNIAARLEGLADPGGICVHRDVKSQVQHRLPIAFEDMGEVEVKNIARPLRVYRIALDANAPAPAKPPPKQRIGRLPLALAGLVTAILIGSGIFLWSDFGPLHKAAQTEQRAQLPTDKPTIAVLPFDNMSNEADQQYFADGLTEDLTTRLSGVSGLFVIARSSVVG